MQCKATIWILSMFYTFLSFRVEAITGLIPINLYLHKLSGCAQLHAHLLSHNYILRLLLESRSSKNLNYHSLSLNSLIHHQRENIKGSIIDMDNRFNEVLLSFDLLNVEFSPSSHLIDIFPSRFSFHPYTKCVKNERSGLNIFLFSSLILFSFWFISLYSIFRN